MTDDTKAAYLAALELLWSEVGREPIGDLRKETTEAYDAVRKIRNRVRHGRKRKGVG